MCALISRYHLSTRSTVDLSERLHDDGLLLAIKLLAIRFCFQYLQPYCPISFFSLFFSLFSSLFFSFIFSLFSSFLFSLFFSFLFSLFFSFSLSFYLLCCPLVTPSSIPAATLQEPSCRSTRRTSPSWTVTPLRSSCWPSMEPPLGTQSPHRTRCTTRGYCTGRHCFPSSLPPYL